MDLTKARLSMLVLVTTAVGFVLAQPYDIHWGLFVLTLVGTALAAGGTSALNQWLEIDRDAAMHRTGDRPLPSSAMSRREAFVAGVGMVVVGTGINFFLVNPLAGFLTLFTATVYVIIYTPMKVKSSANTLVGAVCGAIPPMIGWSAAAETLSLGAWLLGAVLFIWQLPHFLALAWMYRDDYARGGFRMLPIHDSTGELTSRIVLLTTLLLVPLSLMVMLFEVSGLVYAVAAFGFGLYFATKAAQFYRSRTRPAARSVFLASIMYLPLLLGAMVLSCYLG